MSLAKLLLGLERRGIAAAMKFLDSGSTMVAFENGGKKFVQLFDKAGDLSKWKIYEKGMGIFGCDAVTKGSREVNLFGDKVLTRLKRLRGIPTGDETSKVVAGTIGNDKCLNIRRTGGTFGDEVIDLSSTKRWDGNYDVAITQTGGINSGTRNFTVNKNLHLYNDPLNPNVYDDPFRVNNSLASYEDDTTRYLRQMEEDQRLLDEQMRMNDQINNDIAAASSFGLMDDIFGGLF